MEATRDQGAIVGIERYDVGDRPQCDQVELVCQIGLGMGRKPIALTQFRAQREQHIKHNADTR